MGSIEIREAEEKDPVGMLAVAHDSLNPKRLPIEDREGFINSCMGTAKAMLRNEEAILTGYI